VRSVWRLALTLLAMAIAGRVDAKPLTVCTLAFHGPDEVRTFEEHLRPPDFEHVRIGASAAKQTSWLGDACRAGLDCDVVVMSGEFGGRFFGNYGFSVGLSDLEEASCDPACAGLFHAPREVFLLACNTLATKDQDERTPRDYLRVLLDHGFEQAAAERVVQMRYGPIGPSFRESLRRVFMGVPRIYGFSSVAPRGAVTAPMLERYFRSSGSYATYLERTGRRVDRNASLRAAFAGTSFVQEAGLAAGDPGATDRDLVCRLYDERTSVADRLRIASQVMNRADFLTFLPTMEVFLRRHPAEKFDDVERASFAAMQEKTAARDEVLRLARELEVSAVKLEVAHFARHMGWMTADEFHRLAVDGARSLLARPLTSEIVDIECEIAKHERLEDAIKSDDLPGMLFQEAEGIRLVDCVAPKDKRVSTRLAVALDNPDESTRLWAVYALSRRLPLDENVLLRLTERLGDDSADVRARVRWILGAQRRLPDNVRAEMRIQERERTRAKRRHEAWFD
jgi:hypothetical protein